jgi:hypothetical protein
VLPDPKSLAGFGSAADALGFAGLALLVIVGLSLAVVALWRTLNAERVQTAERLAEERSRTAERDALILSIETEHQRLLTQSEATMERLREAEARCRVAEEQRRLAESRLADCADRRRGGRWPWRA